MIRAILKIIEYALGLLFLNKADPVNKRNKENELLTKENEKSIKIISEAHKTKNLDDIRKEASE